MAERWVLLRGLLRERRHWGDFPQRLARRLECCEVICPDLPGNGARWREQSPSTIDAMVESLRANMGPQANSDPIHLLALSMGGMIATAWMQRYPAEVASAALINTSMRPFSPFFRRLKPVALIRLLLACGRGLASREAEILALTANRVEARGELLAQWRRFAADCPVSGANALRQLTAAARFSGPPSIPGIPILLLAGARDRLVDVSCSRTLAAAWRCPCAVHPEGGHDLPLDDPGWVLAQIERFAAGNGKLQGDFRAEPNSWNP